MIKCNSVIDFPNIRSLVRRLDLLEMRNWFKFEQDLLTVILATDKI